MHMPGGGTPESLSKEADEASQLQFVVMSDSVCSEQWKSRLAYPVWSLKILDGGTLCQELRVAQNLKVHIGVSAVPPEHL